MSRRPTRRFLLSAATAAAVLSMPIGSAHASGCVLAKDRSGYNNRNDVGCDFRSQLRNRTDSNPLDLSNSEFSNANFSGSTSILNNTDFHSAFMPNADFSGAWVTGSNFVNARATSAKFQGTHLAYSNFRGANLWNSDFTGADFTGVSAFGLNSTFGMPSALPTGWAAYWGDLFGPYMDVSTQTSTTLTNMSQAINNGAKVGRVCGVPASLPAGWVFVRPSSPEDLNLGDLGLIGTKYDCHGLLVGPRADLSAVDGTDQWEQPTKVGVDFSGQDLRSYKLSGADLTGANLSNANLSGMNLTSTTLTSANLAGANLTGTDLSWAKLAGADLTGANGTKAKLANANLDGAILDQTNLSQVSMSDATAQRAHMFNTNFSDAFITRSSLNGAVTKAANFSHALLDNDTAYDFQSGQNVGSAPDMLPTDWDVVNNYFVGPGMRLYGAQLAGADLHRDFRAKQGWFAPDGRAHSVDLTGADLLNTNLSGANLTGVSLADAWLQGTNLAGATLTGVSSPRVRLGTRAESNNSWARPTLPTGWTYASDQNCKSDACAIGTLVGPGAILTNSTIVNTDMACTDLTGAQLDGITTGGLFVNVNSFAAGASQCRAGVVVPSGWTFGNGFLIGPKANLAGINVNGLDLSTTNLAGATSGKITGTPAKLPAGWGIAAGWFVGPGANLAGADLSNQNLTNLDMTATNLVGAKLSGADLTNSKLKSADLTNALMVGTTITATDLSTSTLTGVRGFGLKVKSGGKQPALPTGWSIYKGTFQGPGASLSGLDLRGNDLSGWNLAGMDMSNTNLASVNLTGAILSNTNLSGADLSRSTLTKAAVDGANFTGATFTALKSGLMKITRGSGADVTNVPPAVPAGFVFANGYFVGPGLTLSGADLGNVNLKGLDLATADLSGAVTGPVSRYQLPSSLPADWAVVESDGVAYLVGPKAKLSKASLRYANLGGLNLAGVDLSSANLDGVKSGSVRGTPAALPKGWKLVSGFLLGRYVQLPKGTSFADKSLTNLDLTSIDAPLVNFNRADLSGTNLTGANLDTTRMASANLSGANLDHTWFANSDLTNAKLNNANVTRTTFTGSTFSGTNVTGVDLAAMRMPEGLQKVKSAGIKGTPKTQPLSPYKLISGSFVGPSANLTIADLSNADLSNMDLSNSNLIGANLTGARLTGTLLFGAKLGDPKAGASGQATLTGVRSGAIRTSAECSSPGPICGWQVPLPPKWSLIGGFLIGPGADLTGANLDGLDLTQATVSSITGTGITGKPSLPCGYFINGGRFASFLPVSNQIKNMDLTGADMRCLKLDAIRTGGLTGTPILPAGWTLTNGYLSGPNADLSNQDFSGVDLRGIDLSAAKLRGTNFAGANLNGVNMKNADLTGANLTGADLGNADLTSAKLTSAKISNAKVGGMLWSSATVTNLSGTGMVGTPGGNGPTISEPLSKVSWYQWKIAKGYLLGPSAQLAGADLSGLDLSKFVDLRGADLTGANLTGTDLSQAMLVKAKLNGANLTGGNLFGTTFAGANLTGATITGATLGATDFQGVAESSSGSTVDDPAILTGIISGGIKGDQGSYMPDQRGWKQVKGYLVGPKANLRGADLRGAYLGNSCAMGSSRAGTATRQCEMGWLKWDGKNCKACVNYYYGIDLSGADFTGADLRGARIINTRIGGTIFKGANMERLATMGDVGTPVLPDTLNYFGDAYKGWDSSWNSSRSPYLPGRFWYFDDSYAYGGSGSIIGPGVEVASDNGPDPIQVVIGTRNIDGGMVYPIYGHPVAFGSWEMVDCSTGPRTPFGSVVSQMVKVTDLIGSKVPNKLGDLGKIKIPDFGASWGCKDSNSYLGEPYNHRPIFAALPKVDSGSFYTPQSYVGLESDTKTALDGVAWWVKLANGLFG